MNQHKYQEKVARRVATIWVLNLVTLAVLCVAIALGFSGCSGGNNGNMVPMAITLTTLRPNSVIRPSSGSTSVTVVITGTNLEANSSTPLRRRVLVGGTGVTVSSFVTNSRTQITATFLVASNATFGAHPVQVVTDDLTSNALVFSVVSASSPTLTRISPSSGPRGNAVSVTLIGTNFAAGTTIEVNTDIMPSNVTVVSPTRITATFNIASFASPGNYAVRVNKNGEKSDSVVFTVTTLTPTLTSITPNSGMRGNAVSVALAGTNFVSGATVQVSGTGVTTRPAIVVNARQIIVTLFLDSNASLGARNVTVTTSNQTSNAVTFTVTSGPTSTPTPQGTPMGAAPTLNSVNPNEIGSGATTVTLTGTNFTPDATVQITGGASISNVVVVSTTQIRLTVTLFTFATGQQSVTVTTPNGISNVRPIFFT